MDRVYIHGLIQKILNKEFSTHKRKKLMVERYNIACPYCQDSHKNAHSKRGNVYLNKLIYICFNCDKTTFDRMCRDFNEQVDPDKS
jgi:C4-type Zn-finger protein